MRLRPFQAYPPSYTDSWACCSSASSMGLQTSLLAGALTLVIMNLPTIMRTAQESLKTVPPELQRGAFGLGAGKWRVIRTVVLPNCIDGIITGCILSTGRILGESAALLFTAGFAHAVNGLWKGLHSAGATLRSPFTCTQRSRVSLRWPSA